MTEAFDFNIFIYLKEPFFWLPTVFFVAYLIFTYSQIDILSALKDGDSSCETAMPDRENVSCCVNIAFVSATTLNTSPFSYLKTA